MFNPDELRRWRDSVAEHPEERYFDGHYCQTFSLELPSASNEPYESENLGELYPPHQIFGHPVDPSCLNGVDRRIVQAPKGTIKRLENARIVGFSAVLSADNILNNPVPVLKDQWQNALSKNLMGHDGFLLLQKERNCAIRFVSRVSPRRFDMDALFIHNIEPGNYGSYQLQIKLNLQCMGTTSWI
jgi:hypothetical protein